MPTPITSRTPSGRALLRDALTLSLLVAIGVAALSGSWPVKGLGLVVLAVAAFQGLELVVLGIRWCRAGTLTLSYDWDEAVPGATVTIILASDRRSLARRDWTVRLVRVAVRRRHGIREETPLWDGSGRVITCEPTSVGSRLHLSVVVPAEAAAVAGPEDWYLEVTGHGRGRPVGLSFAFGVHGAVRQPSTGGSA